MFTKNHNLKGSALIIALLTITVISSIGFTVGRLMVSGLKQSNQLEDSMSAYYVAESGIEQGLLLWWYNQDVQVPEDNMSEDIPQTMRVYLDDMSTTTGDINTPDEGSKNQPYYDLRIWYKNEIVDGKSSEVVCSQEALDTSGSICTEAVSAGRPIVNTGDQPALEKDGAVEYDVEGIERIKLKWEFTNKFPTEGERKNYLLELLPISDEGELLYDKKKNYRYEDRNSVTESFPNNIKITRFRIYGNDLAEYSIETNVPASSSPKLSSRYSIIESTGYFSSAKRRLQIKIDRYSKTILGPYDLVIYQGE